MIPDRRDIYTFYRSTHRKDAPTYWATSKVDGTLKTGCSKCYRFNMFQLKRLQSTYHSATYQHSCSETPLLNLRKHQYPVGSGGFVDFVAGGFNIRSLLLSIKRLVLATFSMAFCGCFSNITRC